MHGIADRLLIWVCCAALIPGKPVDTTVVISMLAAMTVSGLSGYLSSPGFCLASIAAYMAASAIWPSFCLFLPLVHYDVFDIRQTWWPVVTGAGLLVCFMGLPINTSLMVIALIAVSYVLKHRSAALERNRVELKQLRDSGHELTMLLRRKNRELVEKQDYEIRLATLRERSRIAREIHDHVGHLLSRSILQVGAVMVSQRNGDANENVTQGLSVVRDTLSQAMDSIRASVHDMHEESLDLKLQIEDLVRGFTFCPIHLDYRLESQPETDIIYCFTAIAKEGLSNIIRHSSATQVTLKLLEHPALYQLILEDNGSQATGEVTYGLGLRSMTDRVEALGGHLSIGRQNGFRLFISIPKGERST